MGTRQEEETGIFGGRRSSERVRTSGSGDRTHRRMSLDLPVEAGPETSSRHNASPVSGPPKRLGSLAPTGVPPPAGEGSTQPNLAQPGPLSPTHPTPAHLSFSHSSRLRTGRRIVGEQRDFYSPTLSSRCPHPGHGTLSYLGLWVGLREMPHRL